MTIRNGRPFGILRRSCVAGVIISGDTPDGDDADEEWVQYVEDDERSNWSAPIVSWRPGWPVGFYALGVRPRPEKPTSPTLVANIGAGATVLAAGAFSKAGLIGAAVGAAHMLAISLSIPYRRLSIT